jgi:hypothetical protein
MGYKKDDTLCMVVVNMDKDLRHAVKTQALSLVDKDGKVLPANDFYVASIRLGLNNPEIIKGMLNARDAGNRKGITEVLGQDSPASATTDGIAGATRTPRA